MRALAKCPKCGETTSTGCEGCISSGNAFHKCENEKKADVIEVNWKIYPETEKEILENE